jgi:hypothetical protein
VAAVRSEGRKVTRGSAGFGAGATPAARSPFARLASIWSLMMKTRFSSSSTCFW